MIKKTFLFFGSIALIGTLNIAQASPLWELNVGDVRTYVGYDSIGNTWNQVSTVIGTTTIGSNEYFKIDQYNYHNSGSHNQLLMRSTDNQVYASDGTNEQISFQIAQIGITWTFFDELHEIIGTELVTIPFAGGTTKEAYVYRHSKISGSPYWYEYVIPGLGHVQEVDWWTNNAPKIEQLTDVTHAPVPVPATMLLFGSGITGLVGTRLRRKKS